MQSVLIISNPEGGKTVLKEEHEMYSFISHAQRSLNLFLVLEQIGLLENDEAMIMYYQTIRLSYRIDTQPSYSSKTKLIETL
jgi:hypothetical protein